MTVQRPIVRKIPLEEVARFAGNLATCVSAGIGVPDSLRTCTRSSPGGELARIASAAADRVASGMDLADALEPDAGLLPPFYIPVIRCGERVGRLDESLRYLERHCTLLVRPARAMRNTWLYPLVIVVFGSIIKLAGHVFLAPLVQTLAYAAHTAFTYGVVALVVGFFLVVPQAKLILDHVKLVLPILGLVERELAVNRFFHSFNMLYSTGGMRVEAMIKLAVQAVANAVICDDLLHAARVIERGGTISEAFAAVKTITPDHQGTIVAGEEAGKLEDAFNTISRATAESVEHRLKAFNQVSYRIVAAAVAFSVAATLMGLVMTMSHG